MEEMMDRIDFRIIALRIGAFPLAIFICACSCALTCRFLLLGEPVPTLAGTWWADPAALGYIIKLSGGIAISVGQVFGLAFYKLKGDLMCKWIHIVTTAISVTVSVLTFQSLIQSGAINARHNTAEYQTMAAESKRLTAAIDRQRAEKERIIAGLLKYKKVTRSAEVGAEYEARIERDEKKLRDVQRRLVSYSESTDSRDFVSASTTYDALGNDVVGFFGLPGWVGGKLAFLLSYAMLIAVALAIDVVGTKLFSVALGDAKPEENKIEKGYYVDAPQNLAPHVTNRYTEETPQFTPHEAPEVETTAPHKMGDHDDQGDIEPHETGVAPDSTAQEKIDAYRQEGTYNGALRALGIAKNTTTLDDLKRTLTRWRIPHGSTKGPRLVVSN
jgi:hypothetical protein